MTRDPRVAAIVTELIGTWQGVGEGQYPTIEPFRYRETTEIVERVDHPALRIDQQTWKETPEGEVVSHWETGLLRISSDGSAVLHDAQPGRSETLAGSWRPDGDGWLMTFASTGVAGDDRVIASTRQYRIRPAELVYEMHMETTATRHMSIHLRATLRRSTPYEALDQ
jgi:hypothetical protein